MGCAAVEGRLSQFMYEAMRGGVNPFPERRGGEGMVDADKKGEIFIPFDNEQRRQLLGSEK
jgi:hypothetical protein